MSKVKEEFIYDNNTVKTRAVLEKTLIECCPSGHKVVEVENKKWTIEYKLTIEGEKEEIIKCKLSY